MSTFAVLGRIDWEVTLPRSRFLARIAVGFTGTTPCGLSCTLQLRTGRSSRPALFVERRWTRPGCRLADWHLYYCSPTNGLLTPAATRPLTFRGPGRRRC
jgi:hypothetical protein